MGREYAEYSKMSIHNHFGGKSADSTIEKPVAVEPTFDLVEGFHGVDDAASNGFDLLAQTNANNLDAAAYLLMRRYARLKGVELLPGVEINLQNWEKPDKVLHVVLVFSPASNVFYIQQQLRSFYQTNNRFVVDLNNLCDLLACRRAVVCVHGLK